jgi:hypothetical protein
MAPARCTSGVLAALTANSFDRRVLRFAGWSATTNGPGTACATAERLSTWLERVILAS